MIIGCFEARGLVFEPVKLHTVSLMALQRCGIFSLQLKLCFVAIEHGLAPPTRYTLRRNAASMMN